MSVLFLYIIDEGDMPMKMKFLACTIIMAILANGFNLTVYAASRPQVETTSAEYKINTITAYGELLDEGDSDIISMGFVYSTENEHPTIRDTNVNVKLNSSFKAEFSAPAGSGIYYIRAYATNSSGTSYGSVFTVHSNPDNKVMLEIEDVENITGDRASVSFMVTKGNANNFTVYGIVYSQSNSYPTINNSNCDYISYDESGNSGSITIYGLDEEETYYVRAYAIYNGNTYYSIPVEFVSGAADYLRTLEPEEVGASSAVLRGRLQASEKNRVAKKGFVYSTKYDMLEVGKGTVVDMNTEPTGVYDYKITGLLQDTTYYYRAFIRNKHGDYEYGNRIKFKTITGYELKIKYYTNDGFEVGNETLFLPEGYRLTQEDLTVPGHYVMMNQNFSQTVTGAETIKIQLSSKEKAFIDGYPDRTFKPDQAITRADVAKVIYALYGGNKSYNKAPFNDVSVIEAYSNAISFVKEKEWMGGYPDGTFKPQASITRAEMAVVLTNVYNLDIYDGTNRFNDVSHHWGRDYINAAAKKGFIGGYNSGSFLPENTTTRAEATTMFANAEGRTRLPLSDKTYTDVPTSHWAYEIIMNASTPK